MITSYILYQNGFPALYLAASMGHVDMVRLLLDKGADVNGMSYVSDLIFRS